MGCRGVEGGSGAGLLDGGRDHHRLVEDADEDER